MANNRVCYAMTKIPDYLVFNVKVPASQTFKAGDVVMLDALPTATEAIAGNFDVFAPTQPTTANLQTSRLALVINGGNFETLSDGRRPDGNPDYTKYEYKAGEIAPVILLDDGMRFYVSDDCLTSATAATVGGFVVGANGTYQPTSVASATSTNYKQALKILAKKSFRLGGQFGAEFASGNVCIVKTL